MLRWFRALMPKEDRFFDLFEEHSRTVLAGAEALRATLAGGPDIEQNITTVMNREDDADKITGEVLAAIRRSFITPFDRGDIKDLITSMDDAIDQMRKTVKSVALFKVTRFEPEMVQMADCIVQGARCCAPLARMRGGSAPSRSALRRSKDRRMIFMTLLAAACSRRWDPLTLSTSGSRPRSLIISSG